jgi:DNA polymerase I-like protein with 3'-5' exonuclease and polymerase domains/5'-3' exonuclease
VGKDVEGFQVTHNEKSVWVNSATYGYENAINMIVAAMHQKACTPKDLILVFEGMQSKKRRMNISSDYKLTRDSRPPEAYTEFNKLKEMLALELRNCGAIAVQQDLVEGDDTLAYLAENIEEDLMIVTNDNDLVVLNGTNKFGSTIEVRVNGEIGLNKYGEFDLKLVTLYKALVGDTSDNIKGVKGFGPAAFLNVLVKYEEEGCRELVELLKTSNRNALAELAEANDCKYLKKIVDFWPEAVKSWKLACLHPEWVETSKQQLQWSAGVPIPGGRDERLKSYRGQHRLVTAATYASALKFLKQQLQTSPYTGFDIETSTPDESVEWAEAAGVKVDVIGSYLVGFSITFGKNNQYTYYVSVKHADSDNITMVQAREMIECLTNPVIQNLNFELPVLFAAEDEDGTKWCDIWKDNGFHGFLPNCLDTRLEASYVDENMRLGLKERSLQHLGYTQTSYDEVTRFKGHPFVGGHIYKDKAGEECTEYQMHELPASHVFHYGADDAMVTSALHNFYKLHMGLEHHYKTYLQVEIDAAYLHAQSFVNGFCVDVGHSKMLEREDAATSAEAWKVLRAYLIDHGWAGTVPPVYVGEELTPKSLKLAYAIVTGQEAEDEIEDADSEEPAEVVEKDVVMSSRMRLIPKLIKLVESTGQDTLAALLTEAHAGDAENLQRYVLRHFKGEPVIKFSNKQLAKLLYEVMALPIRVRNKATDAMRAKGIREGNPKADALAIAYAMRDAVDVQQEVLKSMQLIQMVNTRNGLYYSKYPYFVHWKTGKIHSSHNQCATNTRRASSSAPNMQQLPKHPKIEGQPAKFREVIIPHKSNAIIVSMDFMAQELRVIADYSQDPNMLACFIGDNLADMHLLTGLGIAQRRMSKANWSYETLEAAISDPSDTNFKFAKECRVLGKKTNFTTEYGAAAPKLAQTLLVSEDDAQDFIDAKEAAFPRAVQWKLEVVSEVKAAGFVVTKLGARRHLAPLLNSDDKWIASKADRQAVNFLIQSSSAEMTKLAEGRMWLANLVNRFDCQIIGPIHDEVVASCTIEDLPEFIAAMHKCMVVPYADMTVPVLSSISFGPNFGIQIEIGEEPTAEAVNQGLKELQEMEAN